MHELGADILKMYLYPKNKLARPRLSKVTDRETHTDRCDYINYHTGFAAGTVTTKNVNSAHYVLVLTAYTTK